MMTNIHVHKILVLFFLCKSLSAKVSHVEIFLQDLPEGYGYWLEQAWQQYKKVPVLIRIDPNVPTHQEIKFIQEKSFFSKVSSVSTKDAVWWSVQTCFGCGALSYFTIAYFIYRVYKIARKIYEIGQWFQTNNKENAATEAIEKFLFRSAQPTLTTYERSLLKRYSKLNTLLKRYGIRNYFTSNKELDQLIEQYNQLDKKEG